MRKLLSVGCIRYSLRMGFKTLSFFPRYLAGRLERPGLAGSAPLRRPDSCGVSCRRRSGSSVSPVGSPLESGVSPAHIGPSNACHRAAPETTVMEIPNKFLSLSLSLSLRGGKGLASGGRRPTTAKENLRRRTDLSMDRENDAEK